MFITNLMYALRSYGDEEKKETDKIKCVCVLVYDEVLRP